MGLLLLYRWFLTKKVNEVWAYNRGWFVEIKVSMQRV
jgi:hypothetical protein